MSAYLITPGTTKPHQDTRRAQVEKVADYLEQHPDSTAKEIDAACDVGSVTKVISDMPGLGYGIGRGWRWCEVLCDGGVLSRMVRTYSLTHRPPGKPSLFTRVCRALLGANPGMK